MWYAMLGRIGWPNRVRDGTDWSAQCARRYRGGRDEGLRINNRSWQGNITAVTGGEPFVQIASCLPSVLIKYWNT